MKDKIKLSHVSRLMGSRSERQIRSHLRKRGIKIRKFILEKDEKRQKIKFLSKFYPKRGVTSKYEERCLQLQDPFQKCKINIPINILRDFFSICKDPHKKIIINENFCKYFLQKSQIENFYQFIIDKNKYFLTNLENQVLRKLKNKIIRLKKKLMKLSLARLNSFHPIFLTTFSVIII